MQRVSIILRLFLLVLQLSRITEEFLLFHSDQHRLCLYADYPLIGNVWAFVPYCFLSPVEPIDRTCQGHGHTLSFTQLYQNNISTSDLFQWQVPVDIVDAYGQFNPHSDRNYFFCNCSNVQWFGLSCEYTFGTSESMFEQVIENQFESRQPYVQSKRLILTTYTGLNCTLYGFDLDWRQICNGLIDCENGEDEIDCHLLETNECDLEHEFRCKSGHCIEKSFAYDFTFDCLDHSDEIDLKLNNRCGTNPSMDCEEFHCASMNYQSPCGDGECFPSGIGAYSKDSMCFNGRNLRSFPINTTENFCQACLICRINRIVPVFDFRNQSSIECDQLFDNPFCNETYCQNLFLTDRPLMYPDVRFFYSSVGEIFPSLICYDNLKCQLFLPTINQSQLTCRTRRELNSSSVAQLFPGFYADMHRLFSACALPLPSNRTDLFHCPHSHQSISYHRLNDGIIDCTRSNDDEKYVGICRYNFSEYFTCLTSNDCLRRENLYNDKYPHCHDRSNQVYPFQCHHRDDLGCRHRRGEKISIEYFLFQELCNNQIHPDLIDDETNCEGWQSVCNLKYRQCDGIINCLDRRDELNCNPSISCQPNELNIHCFRYPDPKLSKSICLPIHLIDNGQIDCYGSIDEDIDYCARQYPSEATRRFHCYNHSECIPLENLCDGLSDCPANDDERLCPNRLISNKCSPGTYFCNEPLAPASCQGKHIRCDGQTTCRDGDFRKGIVYDEEKLCHLITNRIRYKLFPWNDHNQYPPEAILIQSMNPQTISPVRPVMNHSIIQLNLYRCHRGVVVRSSMDGKDHCLCPPAYYGQFCQYQSERISIILNIRVMNEDRLPGMTYKLLIRLQTSRNLSYDAMQLIYSTSLNKSLIYKYIVYLKLPSLHQSYSVIIDIFQISKTEAKYHSSFYHPVPFSFLPVQRLARQILINDHAHSTDQCERNCFRHGQCRIYANTFHQTFCLCSPGWTGEFCQEKQSDHCSTSALMFHSSCLCPLTFFGRQCFAHFDFCLTGIFCRNGGTCIPTGFRSFLLVCLCPIGFHGIYCEYSSAKIHITLKNLWVNQRSEREIPLIIVQLASVTNQISLATIFNRDLFRHVPMDSQVISYSQQWSLPTFALVQVYFDTETQDEFYLVALLKRPVRMLLTSILPSNRCPRVNEFLNFSVMSLSYMQRVKHYYRPCLVLGTRCFYDDMYICLCDNRAYLDCIRFNHSDSRCTTSDQLCLNGGQCYQPKQKSMQFEFSCVCPRCYFGDHCQFTLTKYTISLDALLDQEIIIEHALFEQNSIVTWTLVLVVLIVSLGLITNGFSILTFAQVKPRTIGCGWYLLSTCIITQFGLVVFGARFVYILTSRIGHFGDKHQKFLSISCIALEFSLFILPPMIDWLNACVSIERTLIVVKGIHFHKRKSVQYAKFVILIIISLNILSGLHELFYRRVMRDSQNDRSWCVIELPSLWLNHYVLMINLFHLMIPFLIDACSIVVLLISIVRRKVSLSNSTIQKSALEILKEQTLLYKVFLISPFILILLSLPRLISSFAFSCLKYPWQKHLLLASYLISSLPMTLTLFIFVLPKTSYKEELLRALKKIRQ